MPLTDARCRSAQPGPKLHKLTDGGELQLWVRPSGARLWRFAHRFSGKQKLLALGVYPTIPFGRARRVREDAKRLLADGLDPAVEKRGQAQVRTNAPTFRGIAEEYMAKLKREDRSEATITKTEWLLGFANAEFGDEPIGKVAAPAILKVLQAFEARERYESARRLRSTVESVFRYAIATARAETDPTYALRSALTQVKPTPRAAVTDAQKFRTLLRPLTRSKGSPARGSLFGCSPSSFLVRGNCGWLNGPSSISNVRCGPFPQLG